MQNLVKAFFALALVAGLSYSANAQVTRSTGNPTQSNPGTVVIAQPSQPAAPVYQPAPTTSAPVNWPQSTSQPVYAGQNAAQVQQIDQQLAQIRQQEQALRQQEHTLRQQRAQLTGQAYAANTNHHDNGKHKGWSKNGKANAASRAHAEQKNDD